MQRCRRILYPLNHQGNPITLCTLFHINESFSKIFPSSYELKSLSFTSLKPLLLMTPITYPKWFFKMQIKPFHTIKGRINICWFFSNPLLSLNFPSSNLGLCWWWDCEWTDNSSPGKKTRFIYLFIYFWLLKCFFCFFFL